MIALVGVDNVAVVETDDAILVCNLDKAQGVKQIVEQLKSADDLKKFL
jgi:mannose-1-phosphate guanylyltransferase